MQESPDNAPAAWLWRPQDEILGSTIRVRVGGSFTFPPAGPVSRVVFVAGGVGVNPFMSMLSEIGHRAAGDVDVRTAYATKVPARGDVVFLDRIAGLYADGRVKGSFDLFATGEGTPPDGKGVATVHARRVAVADVERLVTEGNGDLASTYVYVCGPAAMTDEFVAGLTESGLRLDPGHVVTEKWW